MSLSGTSTKRHSEAALRAQLESMRPGQEKSQLTAGQITNTAQAIELLQQHSLHLAGKTEQPQTSLEDVLAAIDASKVNRRSLDILVNIVSNTKEAATKAKVTEKIKDALEADPKLAPASTKPDSLRTLLDYISGDEDTKKIKVKEFANNERSLSIESFANSIKANSALRGLLNIAKDQGLDSDLKALEKEFTERFTQGKVDSFSDYEDLRAVLAKKIIESRRAFAVRGQAALNTSKRFNTVSASASEMNLITKGKNTQAQRFSLDEILYNILEAKDQQASREAISSYHTMISVLENRWVNGNPTEQRNAAEQMEILYAIVKNKSIMGDIHGVFQSTIIDNMDILAEIPDELSFATTNNQEHLYAGLTNRLVQLGITALPNTLGAFVSRLNQERVDLAKLSEQRAEALIPVLFQQNLPTKDDLLAVEVAREVTSIVDEDNNYSVDLKAKLDEVKREITQRILDQFNYTNGQVDFSDTYNQQIADLYFGGHNSSIVTDKANIERYIDFNFPAIVINSQNDSNLRVLADTYLELEQIQNNPNHYTQYLKGFIEKSLINPRSISGLKSIASRLQNDGVITSTEETRLNKAFDSYTQNPNQAANAFEDLANIFLGQPGYTFELFYSEVYTAANLHDSSSFHSNSDHLLGDISSSVEQLRDDIINSDQEVDAERILFNILVEDEIKTSNLTAGEKHPAQGKQGLLERLMSYQPLGSEDITKGTPKLVALAELINRVGDQLYSGSITPSEYQDTLKYIEDRLGLKMRAATTIYRANAGVLADYQDYCESLNTFAHKSVELARLNISLDNGADGALARRIEKSLGKEVFTGEQMQANIDTAQDFAQNITNGQSPYEWAQANGSNKNSLVRLAMRMSGQSSSDDYATIKGLEQRGDLSSENISDILDLIRNFVQYFMRAKIS